MKINLPLAIALLLVVFAVITGIAAVAKTVDVSDAPAELQTVWHGIVYVLHTSAVAPLFVFIRNIFGYLTNKYGEDEDSEVEYEKKQLLKTWLTYESYIKGVAIMTVALTVNTPVADYAYYISGAIAFVIDLVRKSLSDI